GGRGDALGREPAGAEGAGHGAEQVAERRPRLAGGDRAGHLGGGGAPLTGALQERPARADHEQIGALAVGLLGAGERLLGLARVADAHDERSRSGPVGHAESAHARDRHRALAGDQGAQQLASHRRAAHGGDHDRAGERDAGADLGADPLSLAQLIRHAGDGARHPGRVRGSYHTGSPSLAITRFSTVRPAATTAPSRSTDPDTVAPASTRQPGPTTEPVTVAPGSIRAEASTSPPAGIRSRFAAR